MLGKTSLATLALAAGLSAQIYAPASLNPNTTELNARSNYPFMRASSRLQLFYDAVEVGGAQVITANRLAFRYDGPTPAAAGTFNIASLAISIGDSPNAAAAHGANFGQNTAAATMSPFMSATNVSFLADANNVPGPEPWGGPANAFLFLAAAPVLVNVPAGGSFIVEFTNSGNTNNFLANALVDAHSVTTDVGQGTSSITGVGCPPPAGGVNATLLANGQLAPGTSISFSGSGYPVSSPVVVFIAAALFGTPIPLPGTTCNLYLMPDLPVLTTLSTVSGALTVYANGGFLPIPRGIAGSFHFQAAGIGAPSGTNPFGINTSNARTVNLAPTTSSFGAWFCGHHLSNTATDASFCGTTGYALRID